MGCVIKYKGQSIPEEQFLQYLNKQIAINNLFNENESLANSVYEALGYKTSIIQDNKSYYRGQIEQPTIDKNGNLILYAREDELYKKAGLKSKGVSMTDDLQSAIEYGNGQLDVSKNLASAENIGIDLERELDRLDENGYYLIQIPKNISNEIVKEAGEVKVIGDKIIIPKGQYKIEQVVDGVETQITLQQKQEAQQLYSQYLNTIFPESKVKDIVYRRSPRANVEKFNKREKKEGYDQPGISSITKEYIDRIKDFGQNLYTILVDIKNPYTTSIDYDLLEKGEGTQENGYDGILSNGGEINVYEPEQIHILSSKKDLEMFRNFINFTKSEYAKYGDIQQFRDYIISKNFAAVEEFLVVNNKIDRKC